MRRNLVPSLSQIEPDGCLGIDRVSLVRIDSNAEQTGVGLNLENQINSMLTFSDVKTHVDKFGLVSRPQIVEDRGLVEVGEVGHVLTLLKLGRVHLADSEMSVEIVLSFQERKRNTCWICSLLNTFLS